MDLGVENAANAKGQRGITARGGRLRSTALKLRLRQSTCCRRVERCDGGYCYALGHVWAGGKADVMASRDVAACTTEYGVQTANSKTILTVCSDLAKLSAPWTCLERVVCSDGQSATARGLRGRRRGPWLTQCSCPEHRCPGCSACGPRPAGHPTSPRHRRARCGHAGR